MHVDGKRVALVLHSGRKLECRRVPKRNRGPRRKGSKSPPKAMRTIIPKEEKIQNPHNKPTIGVVFFFARGPETFET